VHLDVPADVTSRRAAGLTVTTRPDVLLPSSETALARAADLIRQARRPAVVAGLGCRAGDAKWLRAFAEALPAPVLTTYKTKGAIPEPHPLSLGVFTGGALEEPLVSRADLIIAFGLDPVELIPRRWSYTAPVLALSRCPWRTLSPAGGGYVAPVHEVVGDLSLILEELAPRLIRGQSRSDWDVAEVDRLRRERHAALEVPVPGLAPHRLVQLAREMTPAGTIATIDAGAHMFPATAYWQAVDLGECLIGNGLATMGFALPAAIAAQLVHPERRVLCFTGDGGLMMVVAELETAARLKLPIVVVVFDDSALSLIAAKQEQRGLDAVPLRYAGPDLVALGKSFGFDAYLAEDERGVVAALEASLASQSPSLVVARIDPSGYRRTLDLVRGAPARPADGPTV
jgi:acetolactate synthase-1/2/3 large subunit